MVYFHELQTLLADKPDFSLLVGPEELMAESVLLGGDGGVCGGANIFPRLYVDLYNAAANDDIETVRRLQSIVMQIHTNIYHIGQYDSSIVKGIKCSLSLMNICSDLIAEPFHRFREPEKQKIKQHLDRIIRQINS